MKKHKRPPAKKLRAIQTSRHFRISHRRHTGRILPHRHTSYPTLAFILLLVGVLLTSWTHVVTADTSYKVAARVEGTAPTQKPLIDSPTNNQKVTKTPISVSGSCETNTYLQLFRNGVSSGIALCQGDGTYSLQTDLFVGSNQLQVQSFSFSDLPGPLSDIVIVNYQPPPNNSPASTPAAVAARAAHADNNPLLLKADHNYRGYDTGEVVSWTIGIEGGAPPYAIGVDWGDGTRQLLSVPTAGNFEIKHIYEKSGGYKGSYPVSITASDSKGLQGFLQLLAIINERSDDPALAHGQLNAGPGIGNLDGGLPGNSVMKYVWTGYATTVLMGVSFWLGESRELKRLARPHSRKHA